MFNFYFRTVIISQSLYLLCAGNRNEVLCDTGSASKHDKRSEHRHNQTKTFQQLPQDGGVPQP